MNPKRQVALHQQQRVQRHALSTDVQALLELLNSAELCQELESLMPVYRERLFSPLETLS